MSDKKEESKSLFEKMKPLVEQWRKDTDKFLQEPKQGTMSEVIKKAIDTQLKQEIFEEVFKH